MQSPDPGRQGDSSLLAHAVDGFLAKFHLGTEPDIEDYVRDYPSIAELLRELLPLLRSLKDGAVTETTTNFDDISRLGDMELRRKLGRGGMGIVYEAFQPALARRVAVKILLLHDRQPASVARFYREARAAALLSHPNIVRIYDARVQNGIHYLILEFIEGETLTAHCKRNGPLCVATAINYTLQVARGLAYAHDQGVIHRDVKPSNLLLDQDGIVKILDMGLARIIRNGGDSDADNLDGDQITETGQIMGTPGFMAPEQRLDSRSADVRSDIFSLGCTLFFLLTGHGPFAMASRSASTSTVPSLRGTISDGCLELFSVLERMTAADPSLRWSSMKDVVSALEQLPTVTAHDVGTKSAPPISGASAGSRSGAPNLVLGSTSFTRRSRLARYVSALVVVAGVAAFLYFNRPNTAVPEPQNTAPSVAQSSVPEDPRRPVPDPVMLQKAKDAIKLKYAGDFGAATQTSDYTTLARSMLNAAQSFHVDSAMPYVLLREALVAAARSGDMNLLRFVGFATADQYRVDPADVIGDGWEQILRLNPTESAAKAIVEQAPNLIEGALANERIETARRLGELAAEAAPITKDATTTAGVAAMRKRIDAFDRLRRAAKTAVSVKDEHLDDGVVNGAVGAYSAFGQRRWDEGFRLLSKSNDSLIANLAERTLSATRAASKLVEVGNAWFDAAQQIDQEQRDDYLSAAAYCYTRACIDGQLSTDDHVLARLKELGGPIDLNAIGPDALVADLSLPELVEVPFSAEEAKLLQAKWSLACGVPIEFINSVGMRFVLIPPGGFRMGTNAEPVESPEHEVRLTRPYYLSIYEVTVGQYADVMGGNAPVVHSGSVDKTDEPPNMRLHPVTNVSWTESSNFCSQLATLPAERQAGRYYALPTEAEWEYAARSGSSAASAFASREISEKSVAWFGMTADGRTHPVGERTPNAFGLYDMHGNAHEWCRDGFAPYSTALQTDPLVGPQGNARVRRGGAYNSLSKQLTYTFRESASENARSKSSGLRAVCITPGLARVFPLPKVSANDSAAVPTKNGD